MKQNPSHKNQLIKLNRVKGQVEAVARMIEDNRYCVDIMTQVRAARAALKAIELGIMETHLNACVTEACCSPKMSDKTVKIKEIMKLLTKYE